MDRLIALLPLSILLGCALDALDTEPLDNAGLFAAQVLPGLVERCGVCHAGRMAMLDPFLEPGNEYESIKAYRGKLFLTDPPEWSLLLNRGRHTGPALTDDQFRAVYGWLEGELIESRRRVLATPPVELGPGEFIWSLKRLLMDPQARITFQSTPLPAPAGGFRLSDLRLHAGPETGIKLRHPLLTLITPAGTVPDPADGFSALDLTVPADGQALFGSGEVLLPGAPAHAGLELVFEQIVRTSPVPVKNAQCQAPEVFGQRVRPILAGACLGCHGGANPLASKAFDMRPAQSEDPMTVAQFCLDTRARVDLMDPAKSLLLRQVTRVEDGGLPNHPLKLSDPAPLRAAVLEWAAKEK